MTSTDKKEKPAKKSAEDTAKASTKDSKASTETTSFSPREIVSELDKNIIGQNDAKRAVSIALRNRWRRMQLVFLFYQCLS